MPHDADSIQVWIVGENENGQQYVYKDTGKLFLKTWWYKDEIHDDDPVDMEYMCEHAPLFFQYIYSKLPEWIQEELDDVLGDNRINSVDHPAIPRLFEG